MNWRRVRTVARTDLKQLIQARDFWVPMVILGALFFFVVPTILLLSITQIGDVRGRRAALDDARGAARSRRRPRSRATPDGPGARYALAVYLFAPVAVVVPLTISTAVGAATIVGERERGTGEFLAHSPAAVQEIYLGKLIASLAPRLPHDDRRLRRLLADREPHRRPRGRRLVLPDPQWWVLMLWVVPPFLALTLSLVLRLSARVKSTAAAQQASGLVTLPLIMIAYSQSTGAPVTARGSRGCGPWLDRRRRRRGVASPPGSGSARGACAARSTPRPPPRRRRRDARHDQPGRPPGPSDAAATHATIAARSVGPERRGRARRRGGRSGPRRRASTTKTDRR